MNPNVGYKQVSLIYMKKQYKHVYCNYNLYIDFIE
jgi:hypothetical protein